jgi:hypothetical protein
MRERKPALTATMTLSTFRRYYWTMAELAPFARRLGLAVHGQKPALQRRIDRRLRGQAAEPVKAVPRGQPERDSDRPLRRHTLVVHYKSDAATRAFFASQIGPSFHFTYHLNQFRIARGGLTYGDLVDEWSAERDRRRDTRYRPVLAAHGLYNRFIRAFFSDPGKTAASLRQAAKEWNRIKHQPDVARHVAALEKAARRRKR